MKIRHILAVATLMLVTASPAPAFTDSRPVDSKEARAAALTARLEEIRAIDTHQLASEEKKALRREVRAIKKELAAISGGVYLSVGALLLIVLLLILLL